MILEDIAQSLIKGDPERVRESVRKAVESGINAHTILEKGLFPGMEVISKLFREEDIFVPEVMMAANAMKAGTEILAPMLKNAGYNKKAGKVVLGTVKDDVHNLGKNLVAIMLTGAGFEVIDLGECVSPEKFVIAAISEKADIVGMSALLTTTMPHMKTTIEALRKTRAAGIKTLVGGACVTQTFADEIGADGYAKDAGAAVAVARRLLSIN
jgi:5-methyltetrahydrofolate--homocysteine methyltransferase